MAMFMAAALPATADRVDFEALPDAGSVRLTLDAGIDGLVRWADGTTEEIRFEGPLREIKLKSSAFSIETAEIIRYVVCPDNPLTSIDLTNAPYVRGLYAQNCRLTDLKPGVATALNVLHVSGNPALGEKLASLSLPALSFLGAAECELSQLPGADAVPALEGLWAWGNKLTSAPVVGRTNCEQALLQDNRLSTLAVSPALRTLCVSGNQLRRLDLKACNRLETLDAAHNIVRILYTSPACASTLRYLYVNDNALDYADMPTLSDADGNCYLTDMALDTQAELKIASTLQPDAEVSLATFVAANQWGKQLEAEVTWTDKDGNALVPGKDYVDKGGYVYTFLKGFDGVRATATCADYPGMTLVTGEMQVNAPTAIAGVNDDNAALSIAVDGCRLSVSADSPAQVTVSDAAGRVLRSGVLRGTWTAHLPVGVYMVNSRKVVVGNGLSN